jgi:hypothetical protein
MKKYVLLIGWLISFLFGDAQQKPHYSLYIPEPIYSESCFNRNRNLYGCKLRHRHQWVGFEGAPVTTYATIHRPIGKPDFNAGIFLYSANYFVGFSAQQIIPQKLAFSGNTVKTVDGKLVPHLFLLADTDCWQVMILILFLQ